MLDSLRNHPVWRWFSELDTLASLVQCLKVGAGVVIGLVASFGGWLDSQPGSIQFVLFLSACLITIWVINGALWMQQWRASKKAQAKTQSSLDNLVPDDVQNEPLNLNGRETLKEAILEKTFHQTVTTSPPIIWAGLYVCDMQFDFESLKKDQHSKLKICVFNGTGSVLELSNILGKVKFKDRNNPNRTGTLPTPTLQTDTARTVATFQEWSLILNHWGIPDAEAKKLLEMLEADIQVDFDLRELKIEVFGQHDRNKIALLPIWEGVRYSRSRGFGKITHHFSMLAGDHFKGSE